MNINLKFDKFEVKDTTEKNKVKVLMLKGEKGESGNDGQDGEDGVSPIVTISKSGKITTLTITDAEGTKTATILDGEDGAITNLLQTFDITRASTTNALSEAGTIDFSDKFVNQFIAPLYDNTSTYAGEDVVLYNHQLYVCTTPIETPEDFDTNKWMVVPVTLFPFVLNNLMGMQYNLNQKQDILVSGTNIKTINNETLLESGNISIPVGDLTTLTTTDKTDLVSAINEVNNKIGNINTILSLLTTPSNNGGGN